MTVWLKFVTPKNALILLLCFLWAGSLWYVSSSTRAKVELQYQRRQADTIARCEERRRENEMVLQAVTAKLNQERGKADNVIYRTKTVTVHSGTDCNYDTIGRLSNERTSSINLLIQPTLSADNP